MQNALEKRFHSILFSIGKNSLLGFVSISGGIASFPEDGDSINKVIQHADMLLYQAKSEGKNRVLLHKAKQSERFDTIWCIEHDITNDNDKIPLDAKLLSYAIIELNISRRNVAIYPRDHPSVEIH